ncbi:hypothetical protein FIU90_12660 [Erythrobacter sp. THAF29]|nr:hypothetical protein FIU90_12660 [Erythrobacter sp. THAF29]
MLALFARLPARSLAETSFLGLAIMLAIYIGARLVSGTLTDVIYETLFATGAVLFARFAMARWLPAIGIAIFLHGTYDAFVGPHTGVASWYPPLCAGFDFVVGVVLTLLLVRKARQPS